MLEQWLLNAHGLYSKVAGCRPLPEAVIRRFLMFSRDREKACNFIKKRDALAQLFSCEFCEIFKNIVFYRTPPVAASVPRDCFVSLW